MNAMIPLAAFFERNKKVSGGGEANLLRWFYLASLRGPPTAG
jgi:hypothetical protein